MSRIFIVRHGDTFAPGEPVRRIGARSDFPLVASGIAQAEALGRWFSQGAVRFDRALAGDLRRTRDTAAIILAAADQPPTIETADWLTEIDHGPDEGRPESAVLDRIGAPALHAWNADATPPAGWLVEAPRRMAEWRAFLGSAPAGDTLIVTSNGAARFALLGRPELHCGRPLHLRTGAFGEIAVASSTVSLRRWDVRP